MARLPVARLLESHATEIDAELDLIEPAEFVPWVLADAFARNAGDRRLRRTRSIVARVPGLLGAGFSRLEPRSRVFPHVDDQSIRSIRCFLGLRVPAGSYVRVEGETRAFERYRCLAFDAGTRHDTANAGSEARVTFGVELRLERAFDPIRE
jgi:hypothetical protein